MSAEPALPDLITALRFESDEAPRLLRLWRSKYTECMRIKLENWMGSLGNEDWTTMLRSFGKAELRRVAVSPAVAFRLLNPDRQGIERFVLTEYLGLLDDASDALGSPTICGIGVDFDGTYELPLHSTFPESLQPLTEESGREELQRAQDALSSIHENCPAAFEFVRLGTLKAVFRLDPARPHRSASGSFSGYAGLMYITNPQSLSVAFIVDSFVHESIHAAIYMYEPVVESLCRDSVEAIQLESPWTGNTLNLNQYVQACFVWWGLFNLWNVWKDESPYITGNDVEAMRQRAARGLKAGGVTRLLSSIPKGYMRKSTVAALELIESAGIELEGSSGTSRRGFAAGF